MSVDELRKCVIATPFQPFALHMADGRKIPVIGRDFILVAPEKGRVVIVYQRNGDFDMLDAPLITGISFESATAEMPAS